MHAVILAAGDGGRLQPHTLQTPKPLLTLHGRPLINHVLDALFAAGVRNTTVVVGYRGKQLRAALDSLRPRGMDITFVENTAYDEGNARSLWAARNAVPGPFVLAMADHLIESSLVSDLITGRNGQSALAVDRAAPGDPREGEATLAHVSDGRVMDLGKGIRTWNALDTGVFWCTDDVFKALTPDMRDGELGAVFATLARQGQLDAVDVTGRRWLDVDTPEDFAQAGSWLDAPLAAVS